MKTRTREKLDDLSPSLYDEMESNLDLDSLSDEELEELLFEEDEEKRPGFFNLPTIAGLSMVLVGIVYLLDQLGFTSGFAGLPDLIPYLPLLGGVLIILLGMGVLSWRPKHRTKTKKVSKGIEVPSGKKKVVVEKTTERKKKKRLTRSRNKKIAGVCAGLADYFNIDPTLVRIAFVVGTIASGGPPFVIAYLVLCFIMPKPDAMTLEERITIIRDS